LPRARISACIKHQILGSGFVTRLITFRFSAFVSLSYFFYFFLFFFFVTLCLLLTFLALKDPGLYGIRYFEFMQGIAASKSGSRVIVGLLALEIRGSGMLSYHSV